MPSTKSAIPAKLFVSAALLMLLLASCATVPKPVAPVKPGKDVETLQSLVSLSIRNSGGSMGGRGYLVFKRPDRFHMVVLSPFGFTVMEIFMDGEHVTCLVPSKQTAYTGSLAELPAHSSLRGWRMMRWVVENAPAASEANGGILQRIGTEGGRETLFFDDRGLLMRKANQEGDQVRYGEYRLINEVAFPSSIELRNAGGDTVKLTFDEPELNLPVDEAALVPDLQGYSVRPLSEFRGL